MKKSNFFLRRSRSLPPTGQPRRKRLQQPVVVVTLLEMADSASVRFQRGDNNPPSPTNSGDTSSSNSCASAVWDPHGKNDSDDSRTGAHRHHQSSSMFPSQIDVAFSATSGGVVDGINKNNEMMETASCSSSESDVDLSKNEVVSHSTTTNHHNNNKTPPERIRYEMLGAPTLLYRHAPSYLSPENRPSTISPQQLFMALYTKDHPVMDWFSPKRRIDTAPRQCPFLTSTNVPCPSRPWGSCSTNTSTLSSSHACNEEANEKVAFQTRPSMAKTISGRQLKCKPTSQVSRKRFTAYNIFVAEKIALKKKEVGRLASIRDIAREWRALQDKTSYEQEADRRNATASHKEEEEVEVEKDTPPQKEEIENNGDAELKSRKSQSKRDGTKKKKLSNKKKPAISAYNLYLEEVRIKRKESGCRPLSITKLSTQWKKTTQEEKNHYQQMADEYNAMGVSSARNDSVNEEGMNLKTEVCANIAEEPYAKDLVLDQSMGINPSLNIANDAILSSIPLTSNNPECQVVPTEVGGPSGFGNCLITIPCQCRYCDLRQPCWFLIHPSGDSLSSVSMSKLSFPRNSSHPDNQTATNGVDVGGRILQISQCGPRVKSTDGSVCLVARTSHYCTVINAHPSFVTSMEQEVCGTKYELHEKARINLSPLQPPHLPVFVACDPKTTFSHFTCPSFAILSRNSPERSTTIHRVLVRDEPTVKVHSLAASLSDISLLEYCSDDRMSLWAAARSIVMPKLAPGFFKKTMGTLAGYGHSLHRIDLRDNSSSFIWSPSHVHYLTEGLHSINGIMADAYHEHLVWVSSTSACNVWALDVRHKPARAVVSWSLPLLCDDIGSHLPVSGIYGRGVIFSQPNSIRSPTSPVMFSLKKDPNTSVLGVYHTPSQMPRFQAKALESAGFQEDSNSSIARSAVFPLPDVDGSVFNIGLATIHCSSKTCLNDKQHRQLDYRKPPANVTYVITMTSLGDIYCHSLLESNAEEQSRALQYPGLPVGTKAIPYPGKLKITNLVSGHLRITLSNRFPIPSSAITPHVILSPDDCCPFKSYDIRDLLSRKPMPESRLSEPGDSAKLAPEVNAPRSMYNVSESEYDISGKKFKVACQERNDCDMKSNIIHHSFPRFGMVLSNQTSQCRESNIHNGRHYRPIALDPRHLVVATFSKEKDEFYDLSTDLINNKLSPKETFGMRPNEELDKDIINALQARYYRKDDANDFDFGVAKWELSSDGSFGA